MVLDNYYKYVLRSLLVSKFGAENAHKINKIDSVSLHATLSSSRKDSLYCLAAFFCALTGRYPGYVYHFNKRTKTRYLAGIKVRLRKRQGLGFLAALNDLSLIEAANFRGFKVTESPNKTLNLNFKHLSFYYGTQRAFDGGLMAFSDASLQASAQICFNSPHNNGFVLRGCFLPAHY